MDVITLKELLKENAQKYRHQVAFQIKADSSYRQYTYCQVEDIALLLQANLVKLGVKRGDRVALLSENRPEWSIAFLAITGMGAVVVPLDAMLNQAELLSLIDDSGAKAIVLSYQFVGYLDGHRLAQQKIVMEAFDKLSAASTAEKFEVQLDDLASIVYTSGTTGMSKGVCLTHKNIMSNVIAVSTLIPLGPKDNFLSVLPLHHTFETTAGFLGAFLNGATITYAQSLKSPSILRNMQDTGVTIMCGVPLLYQLFYDGIEREIEAQNKQKVFGLLLLLAKFFKNIVGVNLGRKIFSMVHKKFGGKIRFFVSGGAAIDPELIRKFDLLGFTILQGYGMTEASPIITCNTLKHNKIGSVGKAVPSVEVKIAGTDPVGEILVFGPNVMRNYYKRKEFTSRILINGWLYTGDVGYLDEEGYLFITGRSKDVIVTGSGVNVYPAELEFLLNKIPLIKECCVMGQKIKEGIRKGSEIVAAIIVPDLEKFQHQETVFIEKSINDEVQKFNATVAEYQRIAKVIVRRDDLPKTRLKKIKRHELGKIYGH